ncbi:MAG: hypothetical protein ACRD3W_15200, partial [Terriglobales bacterium]
TMLKKQIRDDNPFLLVKYALTLPFSGGGTYIGNIDGREARVRYLTGINNSLQPTMHVRVDNSFAGGSIIRTEYKVSIFIKAFLILWMSLATAASITIVAQNLTGTASHTSWIFAIAFPLFGTFFIWLGRMFAHYDEQKLEALVGEIAQGAQSAVCSQSGSTSQLERKESDYFGHALREKFHNYK